MTTPEPEIIQTEDGSHTLHSHQFNQRYHSYFGAVQESVHVFLEAGLKPWYEKGTNAPIHIGEIGFGTGLNAYLVAIEASRRQQKHTYYGLEKFPISLDQAKSLNYPAILNADEKLFYELHLAEWEAPINIGEYFEFHKRRDDMLKANFPANHFDTFFYDAFSPETQPELWTADCLKIAFDALKPGGHLVTYCAKGDVKRALKSLGFTLEKGLPGPGRKREMTRATKP